MCQSVLDALKSIDDSGLEQIRDLVLGDDYDPVYRTKTRIVELLASAGWQTPTDDMELSRPKLTLAQLKQMRDIPKELSSFLLKLVDPKCYRGSESDVRRTVERLNEILFTDGLKIKYVGIRPEFELFEPEFDEVNLELAVTPLEVVNILSNVELESLISERIREAELCKDQGAYTAAIVLLGSSMEALLYGFASDRSSDALKASKAPRRNNGSNVPLGDWKFNDYITVCNEIGWIGKDVSHFGDKVRDYRNLVHVTKLFTENYELPDAGTCRMIWPVMHEVIYDLKQVISNEQTPLNAAGV